MNYCGKECDACNKREELNCPGCYKGPGKPVTGDCAIARCCRERKISACAHCTSAGYCGMLKTGKDVEERLRQKEEQEVRRQFLAEHSSVMGKWVGVLCWLVVPGLVHTVLKNLLPSAQGAAQVLEWIDLICTAVYGIILLYLGHKNTLYRRAGILALVSTHHGYGVALAYVVCSVIHRRRGPSCEPGSLCCFSDPPRFTVWKLSSLLQATPRSTSAGRVRMNALP